MGEIGGKEALRLLDQAIAAEPSWYVRDYAYRARGRIESVAKMVEKT